MARQRFKDPAKRAAKRAARREALARGALMTTARDPRPTAQMDHASGGRAIKKRREGDQP